jgi:hypothetical protein
VCTISSTICRGTINKEQLIDEIHTATQPIMKVQKAGVAQGPTSKKTHTHTKKTS